VIVGSHRDLKTEVAEGRLRADLYLRLTDHTLVIPPLRERRDDIVPLARLLLARAAQRLGVAAPELTLEVEQSLVAYDWPGNAQELNTVMERAALLSTGRVEAENLALPGRAPLSWKQIERRAIEDALRMQNGNRTRAARQLGISLRTLQYRLKEYSMAKGA
jgi:two-component system response regulator HydG